jgi:hypothetical protein
MEYLEQCRSLLNKEGFKFGETPYIILPANTSDFIEGEKRDYIHTIITAFESFPNDFRRELANTDNNQINDFAHLNIAYQREKSLRHFDELLQTNNNEATWQKFFIENTWIFGYGLRYQFLNIEQQQVLVGGKGMDNKGGQITDFLASTTSENAKYSVLIEIKTPQTKLLHTEQVRNRVIPPHHDLSSAVAQVLSNVLTWQIDGSQDRNNFSSLDGIHTVHPRSVLVIGNSAELTTDDLKTSFELYRRNIKDPEIITFDELRKRAAYIVNNKR